MEKTQITMRKMTRRGEEVSLLGFGCMRFPTLENGEIDEEEAEKMLDTAYAAGVNYFDTAYFYHNRKSEEFVGRVMEKYERSSFYLATKLPLSNVETLEDVDRIFEGQLQKLRTDYIDFYLLHALDGKKWDVMLEMGAIDRLEELQAEGKIRNLGFSFHDSYEEFERILNARDWDFCQIQFNYMDRNEQAGTRGYELAERKGVPMVIMEPVKGGSLASFTKDIEDRFHALDPDASVASYALRWVGSHPNVKVVLSGMSSMEQLEDNLGTFSDFKPLTDEENATVDEVVRVINSRIANGCTGCSYCMPCPMGVNIPKTFRLWNTYHMYQNYNMVGDSWERMDDGEKPQNCVRCGRCEMLCPQKISIRDDLARAQRDLDSKEMVLE